VQNFQKLQDPGGAYPLNNRVIQGEYAPGSTFKLATSLASLKDGLVSAQDIYDDTGSYTITGERPSTITNARRQVNGRVNIAQAITVSSDVFFYSLGQRFWDNRGKLGATPIQEAARSLGMGDHTGVDLPFEADGRVPDPASRAALSKANPGAFPTADWFTGDNVNLAVGQGEMVLTPLQLANAYATFANGGTLYAPHVGGAVLNQSQAVRTIDSKVLKKVDLAPAVREPLLAGFRGVVGDPKGTAFGAFSGFPLPRFPVAGKTGTAEVGGKQDTSLFVAFAPVERPKYVVAVVMEEAGLGASAAAPVVRRIMEGLAAADGVTGVAPQAVARAVGRD